MSDDDKKIEVVGRFSPGPVDPDMEAILCNIHDSYVDTERDTLRENCLQVAKELNLTYLP